MASARGNSREAFINPYELQKMAICARNQKKLDELNLTQLTKNLQPPPVQPRKRMKQNEGTREALVNNHNLRRRPERTSAEIAIANDEIHDCETIGDFLSDNEVANITKRKRNGGRKHNKMEDILKEGSVPRLKIDLNKSGQPIGDNCRKLAGVLGIQTRKLVPIGFTDWRCVDTEKKEALWEDIKKRFDIDDNDKTRDWVLNSAASKWKQFKSKLKREIFDETLTDEEMKNLHGQRIDDHALDSLLKYWRSPESQALTVRGKNHRAKLKFLHTSGSASYASTAHKMGQKLGRSPRRDEVFVKTHTQKNGVPLSTAASTINELKEVIEAHPELKDMTIQQGDAFAAVCGVKEPRGRVHCLGLGPTPQEIGTPGLKAFKSTKLQMQVLARQKVESENMVLRQTILEMQEREQQMMAQQFPIAETNSQHGSNSRQYMSPGSEGLGEDNQHEGDDGYTENGSYDEEPNDDAQQVVATAASPAPQQVAATAASPAMNIIASPRNDVQKFSHDALAGSEVILFAMSGNEKVAKATIVSVNPNNNLAGVTLGTKFCEVIVSNVFRREALVPRPYAEIRTLGDALHMPVAWPFNRLKVCSLQPRACKGAAAAVSSQGAAARSSQGAAAGSSHGAAAGTLSQGGAAARSSQGAAAGRLSQGAGLSSQRH